MTLFSRLPAAGSGPLGGFDAAFVACSWSRVDERAGGVPIGLNLRSFRPRLEESACPVTDAELAGIMKTLNSRCVSLRHCMNDAVAVGIQVEKIGLKKLRSSTTSRSNGEFRVEIRVVK